MKYIHLLNAAVIGVMLAQAQAAVIPYVEKEAFNSSQNILNNNSIANAEFVGNITGSDEVRINGFHHSEIKGGTSADFYKFTLGQGWYNATLLSNTANANSALAIFNQAGSRISFAQAAQNVSSIFKVTNGGTFYAAIGGLGEDFSQAGGNNFAYRLNLSNTVAPVPEPETYALMGLGLLGLLARRRKATKKD